MSPGREFDAKLALSVSNDLSPRPDGEWRWTEDLDAPVPSRRGTHPVEVDRSGRLETRRQRLARVAVEGLAGAWSLQGQKARRLRCDQKGVRNGTPGPCPAASSEP